MFPIGLTLASGATNIFCFVNRELACETTDVEKQILRSDNRGSANRRCSLLLPLVLYSLKFQAKEICSLPNNAYVL